MDKSERTELEKILDRLELTKCNRDLHDHADVIEDIGDACKVIRWVLSE